MAQAKQQASLGQRWAEARATKTVVFWSCVASIVLTMVVGFSWGGWVMGSTAQKMAETTGEEAVVGRLTPMCVVKVNQDPKKADKIKELKEISAWQQADYVKKQGWATMPGEQEPESRIAEACAKLITK